MPTSAPTPRSSRPAVDATSPVAWRTVSTSSAGRATASATACVTSWASAGSGRGSQICAGGVSGSGVGSSSTCPMSIVVTPSTIAWWVLVITANRPSARPSTRYISHSGRSGSSGRDISRATSSVSWASVPGRGSAERRTWNAMSKSPSSTQTGRARSPGTRRTFCRYRGTADSRRSTVSTRRS